MDTISSVDAIILVLMAPWMVCSTTTTTIDNDNDNDNGNDNDDDNDNGNDNGNNNDNDNDNGDNDAVCSGRGRWMSEWKDACRLMERSQRGSVI